MNPQTAAPSTEPSRRARPDGSPRVYSNLVGGKWVPARSGKTVENRNPANTRDLVGRFPIPVRRTWTRQSGPRPRHSRPWRLVPAPRRAEVSSVPPRSCATARKSWRAP